MDLKEKTKQLPSSPGVYLMKDSLNTIIYVGKSKNLKSRVQTYFQNSRNHTAKVEKMVKSIRNFDYIVTDTEFEALLLECQLIKLQQPIFNRMMKNPQAYCYIAIQMNKDFPQIKIVSTTLAENHLYFGPYTSRNMIEKAIQGLKEFFKIDCSSPANSQKSCLNYSLGLCMGTCLGGDDVKKNYTRIINRIVDLLNRSDKGILIEMEEKMHYASENFDFKTAAKYRDYMEMLHSLLYKEKVIQFAKENKKIAVVETLDKHIAKLFLIEGDQLLFRKKYEWDRSSLDQLCAQIYEDILIVLDNEKTSTAPEIQKDEIDRAQIIYSYLQNAETYTLIEDEWLFSKQDHLNKAIVDLMRKATNSKI